MSKELKQGPKEPRNKHKQIFLIEGHPETLYEIKEEDNYTLVWKDENLSLGKCGEKLPKVLQEMNQCAQIISSKKPQKRCIKAPKDTGTIFRKVAGNTHVIIQADTEEHLYQREEKIREFLTSKGIMFDERCKWQCTSDKKHPEQELAPASTPVYTQVQTPAPQQIPTVLRQEIFCKEIGITMNLPEDCIECSMEKTCEQYNGLKNKI